MDIQDSNSRHQKSEVKEVTVTMLIKTRRFACVPLAWEWYDYLQMRLQWRILRALIVFPEMEKDMSFPRTDEAIPMNHLV